MSQRKISECISVRINVGNYQHIELTKYAEESIEYSSEQERIEKEEQLTNDLITSLKRGMKSIPEKLGKGIEQAIEVEESICKAIPEWLENSAVPNIANGAEKKHIQVVSEQKQQKDEATSNLSEVICEEVKPDPEDVKIDEAESIEPNVVDAKIDESEADLFEEEPKEEPKGVEVEVKAETKVEESKTDEKSSSGELNDFFDDDDDDDLFS